MASRPSPVAAVLVAAGLALCPPAGAAGSPRDDLLRLVPPDSTACFVIQGLRDRAKAVADSPFAAWMEGKLGSGGLGIEELNTLKTIKDAVAAQIGISLEELRDDILGDAVVFAFRPGKAGAVGDDTGLFLLKARNPDRLKTLVGRLNELQKATGEIGEVREKAYQSWAYFERTKPKGHSDFYLLRDGLLVFSSQEDAVRGAIDQARAAPSDRPPLAEAFAGLGVGDALIVGWFNPRGLDAELKAKAEAADKPRDKAYLTQFAKLWAALDGVAVYLDAGKDLELGVTARYQPDKLPAEFAAFVKSPPAAPAVPGAAPDDALFSVGGIIEPDKLFRLIDSFLPADERGSVRAEIEAGLGPIVGKDKLPALLEAVGPDWAAWAVPPAADSGRWVPTLTAAIRVRADGPTGPAVLRAVSQLVETGLLLLRVEYNRDHDDQIEPREETVAGVRVQTLANDKGFPAGFRPGFAVKDGYLLFVTSPEAVSRFTPKPASATAPAETVLVRIAASRWREYLTRHRADVARGLARLSEREPDDVARELRQLTDALAGFDAFELLTRAGDRRTTLALRIRLVKPLAK